MQIQCSLRQRRRDRGLRFDSIEDIALPDQIVRLPRQGWRRRSCGRDTRSWWDNEKPPGYEIVYRPRGEVGAPRDQDEIERHDIPFRKYQPHLTNRSGSLGMLRVVKASS